ncbi:MauE/DoxX family redox-associated membrane protein [Kiritimatiellaeota bacterium B1221]|nr:MauE/DoxX family redox-associated membrane protein [Kiritimatiellaeota bacterium B1221]
MTDDTQKEEPRTWRNYIPLMVLVSLSALSALALTGVSPFHPANWMHRFMGLFLVMFSMFKFFNLSGFADGFQMYDLLAKRFRPYAFVYPFLELSLGLAYLARFSLREVYAATIMLMLFGACGVFNALRNKLKINCACMGTVLDVPLSTVALVEDLGMAVMAALMLWVQL